MNRFKELRIAHGFKTQKDLADALFVNQTAVSQWERGATRPTSEMQMKLSRLYNVSIDYLLGNDVVEMKSPANPEIDEAGLDEELIRLLCQLEDRDVVRVQDFVRGLIAAREAPASHQD